MSLNHIIKDVVPDDEKLDVKFGTIEADNIDVSGATFENLTITNDLDVGNEVTIGSTAQIQDIVTQNINCQVGALFNHGVFTDYLTVQGPLTANNIKANTSLFKSKPYLNSNTISPQSQLQADEVVNGMLIFDDTAKTTFTYKMPYKGDFDAYLGLSGTDEYAFRFDMTIFATMSTGGTYSLAVDSVSGVSINYVGTYTKVLPHTTGSESTFTFIGVRQSDGTYIVYG
jgi:hypothetical protein